MAEAAAFRRSWHGASDRHADPAVAALRLQRAEVDALLAFRHAEHGEEENLAWWRLQRIRTARLALLDAATQGTLSPLPAPPAHALSWWQGVKHRVGRFQAEREQPPAAIARKLAG